MIAALDAQRMLQDAVTETGLSDWADDGFPERFALAAAHINTIPMDAAGRQAAKDNIHWLLTDRLRFFQDRNDFPLSEEQIERPMFASGEPRSGTTLMHALMSVDPDARALRFAEVMHPSPPPGSVEGTDPRYARADAEWREINTKMAKWLHCHPYNDMLGSGLPEDERTWAFDFRVMTPTAWWRVPMQNLSMGLPTDPAAQYRIHKAMLQAFQYGREKKYWVLKGFHTARLEAFFDAYPDATLVWLHRDPVMVAASSTMMMSDIMEGIVGPIDLVKEAQMHLERVRWSIGNTMSGSLVDDPRIHHVLYSDFVADPIGTVRGYYAFAGREFTAQAEAAMRAYLAANRGDRHGKFQYSTQVLIDAGYDIEALNTEFAPFRARFGVPIEVRGSKP
ncbi:MULTISPECIES: sulfotransferase [unclassified Novosphingobium]|uniref:sulfotransferase family protein n=1 Tax=unclassified Novosphingobium TaxID=2644732 RepID=UPI0013597743|nr:MULTISPECIES: sulfotransferase [unclassified Novosphingobium]